VIDGGNVEYRYLGSTGMQVSVVGLGCNNFGMRCDAQASAAVVHAALDSGINFFDTADVYGGAGKSEEYLGQAIKGLDRTQIILATKFSGPMGEGGLMRGASRRHIYNAVDASLKRLGTDYIDLYQQHGPDSNTPLEETLRALDDLVCAGKVRYIGCSNYAGWQVADAHWTSNHCGLNAFVSAQNLYSLIDRRIERELAPSCERFGLGILPYFPLASGLLTGKYRRGEAPAQATRLAQMGERGQAALSAENFDIVDKLTGFAEAHGHTLLELAMSWLVNKPCISSVISGATSAEQVTQNAAAGSWQLTAGEMEEVDALSKR
jgi:aryl-alcohol dehydrogenase-like predicted oxidoreductase